MLRIPQCLDNWLTNGGKSMYALDYATVALNHTSSRQPNGRKFLCIQSDLQYGNVSSHYMLKVECCTFAMMS
jgi:hypothetical protein